MNDSLELDRSLQLLAAGSARCYGPDTRNGRLGLYADEEMVAYDPTVEAVVDAAQRSVSGWGP